MQKIRRSAWFVSLVFMTACSDSDPSDSDVNNPTAQNQSSVVPEDAITSPETDVPNLNGNTLDDTTNTETTNESLPPEPTGLKGVVYTDTEIELFWDRSSDTNIVNYTVSRDGAALSTVDALSYFDNTVVSGTTYE